MKKLVATLSLAALATGAFAQGFVTIANNGGVTAVNTMTQGVLAKTGTAASSFYYDVLINASTVTTIDASLQGLAAAGWSDSGLTAVNGTGALGAGKMTAVNTSSSAWAASTEMSAIVIGWSGNLGTSVSNALAAVAGGHLGSTGWTGGTITGTEYVGYTTIATAVSGSTAGTAAALFNSLTSASVPVPISGTTTLFAAVPEPGTMALAGLGVASLMIFRRRK